MRVLRSMTSHTISCVFPPARLFVKQISRDPRHEKQRTQPKRYEPFRPGLNDIVYAIKNYSNQLSYAITTLGMSVGLDSNFATEINSQRVYLSWGGRGRLAEDAQSFTSADRVSTVNVLRSLLPPLRLTRSTMHSLSPPPTASTRFRQGQDVGGTDQVQGSVGYDACNDCGKQRKRAYPWGSAGADPDRRGENVSRNFCVRTLEGDFVWLI